MTMTNLPNVCFSIKGYKKTKTNPLSPIILTFYKIIDILIYKTTQQQQKGGKKRFNLRIKNILLNWINLTCWKTHSIFYFTISHWRMGTISQISTRTETSPSPSGHIFCLICFQGSIIHRRNGSEMLSNQHGCMLQFIKWWKSWLKMKFLESSSSQ